MKLNVEILISVDTKTAQYLNAMQRKVGSRAFAQAVGETMRDVLISNRFWPYVCPECGEESLPSEIVREGDGEIWVCPHCEQKSHVDNWQEVRLEEED